jgi:hypothetical protein
MPKPPYRGEQPMSNNLSISRRWAAYRPSKGGWLWSCVGASVATMIVGFAWGGWVTGGTATRMAADAAQDARAQLAAANCVYRFNQGPDMAAQLAALKKVQSYEVNGLLVKGGWATMPGDAEPVVGAANICAHDLMNPTVVKAASNG